RVMRLLILFMLAGLLHVSATTYSQTVTLRGENMSIINVIKTIRAQTGLAVYADAAHLNAVSPITVNVKNMPVSEFLTMILADLPLEAKLEDKTITIERIAMAEEGNKHFYIGEPMQQRTITGEVTDEAGQPLAGVTVSVKNTVVTVFTDDGGNYRIAIPVNENALVFTMVGFETTEQALRDRNVINVSMKSSVSDLDE